MRILIGIFFIFVGLLLTSKFKININYFEKEKNSLKLTFHINLGLYILGFIKIIGISLKEDGIHFLFFRFSYNKIKIDKDSMKLLKNFSVLDILKSLHLRLEKFEFILKIGCENMMITVFSVFAIASFLSIFAAQKNRQINLKNYTYKIMPVYHTNQLEFSLSSKISIKTLNIIQTLILVNNHSKKQKQSSLKKVPIKI